MHTFYSSLSTELTWASDKKVDFCLFQRFNSWIFNGFIKDLSGHSCQT